MHNELFTCQTDQGCHSLHFGSNWIPARAIYSTRGSAFPFDSLVSADGIPISVYWRTEIERDWQASNFREFKERRRMKLIKNHPISATWWLLLLTLGGILQIVVK